MLEIFKRQTGTLRRAAVESVRACAVLRHKFPDAPDCEIAQKMWRGWMCINERFDADFESDLRLARLLDVQARRQNYTGLEDVVDIYFDILYIETGIDSLSKRAKAALDVFFDIMEQNGITLSGGTRRDYQKKLKAKIKAAKAGRRK